MIKDNYDYIIIGSGFGGSVSAMRLAEKGYSVLVIEKGQRKAPEDFPDTNWNLKKYAWEPNLGWYGIQQTHFFKHITILSGVGVGGGSLVYANTLPKPGSEFFKNGSWGKLNDWESELEPFYDQAWEMLGADKNPKFFEADNVIKEVGNDIGTADSFKATKVAVYFGEEGETVDDPYHGGKGPTRTGCIHCGACMVGCKHNAKNSLDKNYLYFAEKMGVDVLPENEVSEVIPQGSRGNGEEGYKVICTQITDKKAKPRTISSTAIIFSGGVLGTVDLLLHNKDTNLPNLSSRLGQMVRTNNESLIQVTSTDRSKTFSDGVAIGSFLDIDKDTHVEPVRYNAGSGFWRTMVWPMVTEQNPILRFLKLLLEPFMDPIGWFKVVTIRDFSKATTVLLIMQTLDGTISFVKNGKSGMKTELDPGTPPPSAFIPEAHDFAKRFAEKVKGKTRVGFMETLSGMPSTAHILGGACMGEDASKGVIDGDNKVFGYDNMYVFDGSMISSNPGVNPALSITAITERGMTKIPKKSELAA